MENINAGSTSVCETGTFVNEQPNADLHRIEDFTQALNAMQVQKMENKVFDWLQQNFRNIDNNGAKLAQLPSNSSNICELATERRRHIEVAVDASDTESVHSVDTVRYILSSRKRNSNAQPRFGFPYNRFNSIKTFRTMQSRRNALREKYARVEQFSESRQQKACKSRTTSVNDSDSANSGEIDKRPVKRKRRCKSVKTRARKLCDDSSTEEEHPQSEAECRAVIMNAHKACDMYANSATPAACIKLSRSKRRCKRTSVYLTFDMHPDGSQNKRHLREERHNERNVKKL